MPAIAYHIDKCQTAEAVLEAARAVRANRGQIYRAPVRDTGIDLRRPSRGIKGNDPSLRKQPKPKVLSKIVFVKPIVVREIDPTIRIVDIQDAICEVAGIRRLDLISARRDRATCAPRHLALALCKALTLLSLPQIGRAFGGRHYTTVLHSVNKMWPITSQITDILDEAPLHYVVAVAYALCQQIPEYIAPPRPRNDTGKFCQAFL